MRRFLYVCALMVSFPLVVRADLIHVTSWTQFAGQTCVTCTQMFGAGFQRYSFAHAAPACLLVSSSGYFGSQFVGNEAIHLERNYASFWHHKTTNGKEVADHLLLGVDTIHSRAYQCGGCDRLLNWQAMPQANRVRRVSVPEPTLLELLLPAAITLWFAGWRTHKKTHEQRRLI